MTRTFLATPARRGEVPLFIGLVGASSSGKTTSALRLATGIQSVTGGDIHLIDTENRRALHYADQFEFKHVQFDPPFGSLDYLAAIDQSAHAGAKTIIVDSMSHEHESVGGMLDAQDQELRRLAGDDYGTRSAERFNMLAWQKPKADRRKLLQGITRVNANIILCFRAKETSKPGKETYEHRGETKTKNVIKAMGFMAIAGEEFVYEMSLSALLMPGSRGIPEWNPDGMGEKIAVKRPRQFETICADARVIDEAMGRELAEWAKGDDPAKAGAISEYETLINATLTTDDATAETIGQWWNSPEQKAARKALNVPDAKMAGWIGAVKTRVEELKNG